MISLKSIKFRPVAWMTGLLGALVAAEAVDRAAHFLPASWSPYLLGAIAVLTAALGALTHGAVTPLAAPHDEAGNPLVPKWAASDVPKPPAPGEGSVGGSGMSGKGWKPFGPV